MILKCKKQKKKNNIFTGADPDYPAGIIEPHTIQGKRNQDRQTLYHAAVRHHCDIEFVHLLYDFGADIYGKENGRLAMELDYDNECKNFLVDVICK